MTTPISLLLQEIPHVKRLESKKFPGMNLIQWQTDPPGVAKGFTQDDFSGFDWLVFSIALSYLSTPLALTSLVVTVPFLGVERMGLLLKKSPQLQRLHLERLSSIELAAVLKEVGKYCLQLSELSLPELPGITQLDLTLLQNCTRCSKLSLGQCSAPIEQGLISWLKEAGGQLKTLSLYRCLNVTENVLKCLSTSSPFLMSLNISGCPYLSGASLVHLDGLSIQQLHMSEIELTSDDVKNCSNLFSRLIELSIGNCRLSDETCRLLAEKCPNMKKMNLRGNPQVSFESLQYLINSLKQLRVLDLLDSSLSQDQLLQLTSIRKDLRIIKESSFA